MSTFRSIVGNSSSQNIDMSQVGIISLNASTRVNISSILNSPVYQKSGTDADVVRLGNSFTGGTSTIVGLLQPVSYSATGLTTMFGYNNLTNSTNGGGACVIYGSRNLLSATSTSIGMIVMGDRNYQTLVSGNNNMAMGTFNGNVLTTGANNIFLGGFTAQTLTTGSNNYTMGFGCSTPATCDHSITMGNSAAGASNQFTFGSGTNFVRFISGCTTNTVDIGSTTNAFKTAYFNTSMSNSGATNVITMSGGSIGLTATTVSGALTTLGIAPSGTNVSDIGSVSNQYKSIHIGTSILGSGSKEINMTGANILQSATRITSLSVDTIYPTLDNTVDLGLSIPLAFRDLYLTRNIEGGIASNAVISFDTVDTISLRSTDLVITGQPSCVRSAYGMLLSTGSLTAYANAYTVLTPIRLITMTSNAGADTPILFTVGATGVMTFVGVQPAVVNIDISFSYANTTNSAANMQHWVSINGSLTAPTNTTATSTRTFLNALNNIYLPESISISTVLSNGNTIQLVGSITPAAALTVNYRSIVYRARAVFI